MKKISYTVVDYVQGGFSLIFVIISILIGVIFIMKYFQYENLQLLLVGLTWIGLASPWFPDSINFILVFFTTPLPLRLNLIIGNSFLPVVAIIWVKAFTDLLYKDKQKILLIIFFIIGIIFEIYFIISLIFAPSLIGSFPVSPFQIVYHPVFEIFLLVFILVFMITGILFGRESLKSEEKEINLKGKFLIIAFISFAIGAILDSIIPREAYLVIITRLILISASLEFYFGFMPPEWLKNFFIK